MRDTEHELKSSGPVPNALVADKWITRRQLLKRSIYSGLAASMSNLLLTGCGNRSSTDPNVVLIVVDTLRADHLGCYGYTRNVSPNIDRLAGESVVFKNAISVAPWTLPSVATMLTSQYPSVLGVGDEPRALQGAYPQMPEIFKENGYETYGIISHILLSSRYGLGQGFDRYDEESMGHQGISSPVISRKAIRFLRQKRRNPFLLFAHYFDPHYDYLLHSRYDYFPSYKGTLTSGMPIQRLWRERDKFTPADIKYLVALYDSEISFTDEYIGKVLDELKRLELYDDCIIIVTADHGEEFMERGWLGHSTTLHNEVIRVPLMIKLPGGKARAVGSPVGLIDIMPTLCSYLGFRDPGNMDGRVLDLGGDIGAGSGPVFSETFNPQVHRPEPVEPIAFRSVVSGRWKLIYDQKKNIRKVYDISEDPLERNDLWRDGKYRELESKLEQWMSYVESKSRKGVTGEDDVLLTPEERRHLESLGYL